MNSPEALPRVLCVDDEPHLLAALERVLFDRYEILTATSAGDALEALKHEPAFDVVISDMRMPGISGADFLAEVRRLYPSVMRVLLTGHADTESAIAAVNRGAIFKFLSKPCPTDVLIETIDLAVALRRRTELERQLLATTLTAVVKLLSEVLAMAAPQAFQRSSFVQACVRHTLPRLQWTDSWRFEMAAALSQIGCIGMPQIGDSSEQQHEQAEAAWRLLASIPRLESVAEMIRYQAGIAPEGTATDVAQGSALLRGALLLQRLGLQGRSSDELLRALRQAHPPLPGSIVEVLSEFRGQWSAQRLEKVRDLQAGSILDQDVRTKAQVLILSKGHELSEAAINALKRLLVTQSIGDAVLVRYREV